MIYVVGTGRCGTGTMAFVRSGMHEPFPRLEFPFCLKYQGQWNLYYQKWLERALHKRSQLKTPVISDMWQSLFIRDIHRIDQDCEFIWLIRERRDCIRSMAKRRTNPFWQDSLTATAFYDRMNREIGEQINGLPYTIIRTKDIGEPVLNTSMEPLKGIDFR